MILSRKKRISYTLLGIVFLGGLWQIAAVLSGSIVVASPVATFSALIRFTGNGEFWRSILISSGRIAVGIAAGAAAGFTLGVAAGLNVVVRCLLDPVRWVLMSVPAVVVVVIAMLWFGLGSLMVVFITGLLLMPIVYVNTVKGLDMVDDSIVEMARLYRFPKHMVLRHVYIPAIAGPVASALVVAVGMGVRVVILAEVMGASEGVGHALALSRSTLEVADLYAWVMVAIAIVGIIEYVLLKPLEARVMRWRS